jgi:hypothetical protein
MTLRRSLAERVTRDGARGTQIDEDAEFVAIIELRVTGEIEAAAVRDRYNVLLEKRSLPDSPARSVRK